MNRYPAHSLEERLEYYRYRGHSIRDFFAARWRTDAMVPTWKAALRKKNGQWFYLRAVVSFLRPIYQQLSGLEVDQKRRQPILELMR